MTPCYRTHEDERAWIEAHRAEFLGQWVVLDGGNLVAHGTDARPVYDEARARGVDAPYLDQVLPKVAAALMPWWWFTIRTPDS